MISTFPFPPLTIREIQRGNARNFKNLCGHYGKFIQKEKKKKSIQGQRRRKKEEWIISWLLPRTLSWATTHHPSLCSRPFARPFLIRRGAGNRPRIVMNAFAIQKKEPTVFFCRWQYQEIPPLAHPSAMLLLLLLFASWHSSSKHAFLDSSLFALDVWPECRQKKK